MHRQKHDFWGELLITPKQSKLDKDIELCRKCIEYWEDVVRGGLIHVAKCSFCAEYNKEEIGINNCVYCPIKIDTGKRYCRGTPYYGAIESVQKEVDMLNYLKSLLKKLISKKYDYNKIMQENTVVHCDTEEKAKDLLEWADACGLRWLSGKDYSVLNYQDHSEETCYYLNNGEFSGLLYFTNARHYNILTPEEVRINTGDSYILSNVESLEYSAGEIRRIPQTKLVDKCKMCKHDFELKETTYEAGARFTSGVTGYDYKLVADAAKELFLLNLKTHVLIGSYIAPSRATLKNMNKKWGLELKIRA